MKRCSHCAILLKEDVVKAGHKLLAILQYEHHSLAMDRFKLSVRRIEVGCSCSKIGLQTLSNIKREDYNVLIWQI